MRTVADMEADKACVEDLGAVNRWPARGAVPVEEYLRLWQASCAEIHATGRLPARGAPIADFRDRHTSALNFLAVGFRMSGGALRTPHRSRMRLDIPEVAG